MKRLRIACLVALLPILGAACSKNGEVNDDLDAISSFSKEIVDKVKSAPNPKAGVAAAAKYLESQRADIQKRMERMGKVRGFQIDDETKQRLTSELSKSITSVMGLKLEYMMQTMNDKELETQLDSLIESYQGLITQT